MTVTQTLSRVANRTLVVAILGVVVLLGSVTPAQAQTLGGSSGQAIANYTPPNGNTTDPGMTIGVVQTVADIDEDGKQDIVLTELSFSNGGIPRFQTRIIDGTTHRVKLVYDNQPNTSVGTLCGNGVVENGEYCDRGDLNVDVCSGNSEDCRSSAQGIDACRFCGPKTGPRSGD